MNHVLLILICCILFVTSQAGSASSGVDLLPLLQPPNVLHSRFWTRYLHSFVTMGQKPFTHFGASQESSSEGCLVRALAKDLSPSPRLAVESAEGLHRVLYRISLKTVFSSENFNSAPWPSDDAECRGIVGATGEGIGSSH